MQKAGTLTILARKEKAMNKIMLSIAIIFCFIFSQAAHAAEEYDILTVDVPHGGGFYHIDRDFLACPVGTPKPVYLQMIPLNKNGGIRIMKDPEGKPIWVAEEGVQTARVPKGCFLKEEIQWENIPVLETVAATGQDDGVLEAGESDTLTLDHPVTIENHSNGEGTQSQTKAVGFTIVPVALVGLGSILLFILISFAVYKMVKGVALHNNPMHPLFQGPMMRTMWWPTTITSILENAQRLRADQRRRMRSGGLFPLSGRMVEVYKVKVSSSGTVMTEYSDTPRPARPSGQWVHVVVYRLDDGTIDGVTMGFRFCRNGILYYRMREEQIREFTQDAIWRKARRIWKADGFTSAPNWVEVENWIYTDLPRSVRIPEPVVATTEPVIIDPSRPLLAPPAPLVPAAAEEPTSVTKIPSSRHLQAVPELADEEFFPTLNLTGLQIQQLMLSGTKRRVILRPEQVTTLIELGIRFVSEGPSEDGDGVIVSEIGGAPVTPISEAGKKSQSDPA